MMKILRRNRKRVICLQEKQIYIGHVQQRLYYFINELFPTKKLQNIHAQ